MVSAVYIWQYPHVPTPFKARAVLARQLSKIYAKSGKGNFPALPGDVTYVNRAAALWFMVT